VKVRSVNDVFIVEVEDRQVAKAEFDVVLRATLDECQANRHLPNIVLDLTIVERLDSEVVGVINSYLYKVKGQGGDLRLVGLTDSVRQVFKITQFLDRFRVFERQFDAVRSFGVEMY
jgi:anti-anti-sigma factor